MSLRSLKQDDDFVPTLEPTIIEGSELQWYQTSTFQIALFSVVIVLILAWIAYVYCRQSKSTTNEHKTILNKNPPRVVGKVTRSAKDVESGNPEETSSLLDNNNNYSRNVSPSMQPNSILPLSKKPTGTTVASSPHLEIAEKFRVQDLGSNYQGPGKVVANEAALMRAFDAILTAGIIVSLHTTKGPRPIVLTLLNGEARWQAVKSAQKRYKLSLRDVKVVEVGLCTSNLQSSRSATSEFCFSLVTEKTTLDLQASSQLERDCLAAGFDRRVRQARSSPM